MIARDGLLDDIAAVDLQWFAAEDEGRTEEPSEYKLKKAREEGRVAKSPELVGSLVMFVTVVILIVSGRFIMNGCLEVLSFYFSRSATDYPFQKQFYVGFVVALAKMTLPMAAAGIVAGVLANIVQNKGFIFSTKPIEPQFSKVSPRIGQYLKKTLFSFEGGFNIVKSFFKVAVVSVVAFIIIRSDMKTFLEFINAHDILAAVGRVAVSAAKILVACSVIFLAIAVPDYFVQKKQFIESMKMTKQEVKQEYKEMEGDPEVKARLDQAQRELLQRNMPQMVAKSDVVIANPTHFAVALLYDKDVSDAPQVMAKGADEVALRIRSIARDNAVPIVENKPLARALYSQTEVGDIIPVEYFTAIATIYTQVVYMNGRKS